MDLHINYCKTFGISEEEIQATEELQGTVFLLFFPHNLPKSDIN